jgi:hypothetical protein
MSRAHAEIAYRSLLYSLHAILKLHTVHVDETYLSLGDGTGIPAQAGLPRVHSRR